MKNKWWIILFIVFLGVIILSLLIAQQSRNIVSLSENEIQMTEQAGSRVPPAYSLPISPALIATRPLGKSGITIIKAPAIELEEKNVRAVTLADKVTNNISSLNAALSLNVATSNEAQDAPQAGITKMGKQPTPKEAQEMNSSGIVMY
jgi:hypothetical protein